MDQPSNDRVTIEQHHRARVNARASDVLLEPIERRRLEIERIAQKSLAERGCDAALARLIAGPATTLDLPNPPTG